MAHLIDKDPLLAEIERRLEEYRTYPDYQIDSNYMELCEILSFLNTLEVKEIGVDLGDPKGDKSAKYIIDTKNLEVKEVDLEKEYKDFVEEDPVYNKLVNGIVGKAIAKHFYSLGLKVQGGEKQ